MQRFFLLAILALSNLTGAQPLSQVTNVEEMIKALTPPAKTRSLTSSTRNLNPTLDLTVNFDFDSARLRNDSKQLLEKLASALNDPQLINFKFIVEGHTDAKGTEAYNEQLSLRRADSVIIFLSSSGVSPERLQPVGKGYRELLDQANPQAGINRRVRVITLQ